MTVIPSNNHHRDLLDSVWRASGSAATSIILISLLLVTLLSIALIPGAGEQLALIQQPAQQGIDSNVSQTTVQVGFVVLSIWLKILLAALALTCLLRLADQMSSALRMWSPGTLLPCPSRIVTQHHVMAADLEQAAEQVDRSLSQSWPVIRCERKPSSVRFFATRKAWTAIDGVLVGLGPLLVLLGLAISSTFGWHATSIALPPEGQVVLQGTPESTFSLASIDNAGPDATAAILASTNGSSATEQRITNHRPGRWGSLWVALQTTGPALIVNAKDEGQRPLLLQSLVGSDDIGETLKVLFRTTQTEQAFAIPTRDLAFRVVSYPELPERGISTPVFLVEAYRSDSVSPFLSELVTDQAEFSIDDMQISVRRDHFALVDAAYLPGVVPILLGALSLLVGLSVGLRWPPRSIWVDLVERGQMTIAFVRIATSVDPSQEMDTLAPWLAPEAEVINTDSAHVVK